MSDYIKVTPYDEAHARRVAWVMGKLGKKNSAAALALADLERRRAAGERVRLYRHHYRDGSAVIVAAEVL